MLLFLQLQTKEYQTRGNTSMRKLIGLSAKIIILSGSLTSISHRSQKYFPEFNLSQAFLEMKETIDNKMGVV